MREGPSIASVILTAFITAVVTAVLTVIVMNKIQIGPSSDTITVPDLRGLTQADAQVNLEAKGLTLMIGGRKADRIAPPGTVVSQTPLPGGKVKPGTTISVTLAGEAPVVPDLGGRTIAEATVLLEQSGFKIQVGQPAPSDTVAKGHIAKQVPPAGTTYEPGRTIVVTPSDGPKEVSVPRLVGLPLNSAKQVITDAGFKVGTIKWGYNEDWGAFIVLKQDPEQNAKAKPGSTIELTVNED
jgi:eukaryotic-like serine/threonine-protein kinase